MIVIHIHDYGISIRDSTWFFSKLVGQIFDESLPRARKERQIAPQASAGYPLSLISLLAIRKAQRGREMILRLLAERRNDGGD